MPTFSKRQFLSAPIGLALGMHAVAQAASAERGVSSRRGSETIGDPPVRGGPFRPTLESLKTYNAPEWFRDAKFGIWSHWGPQAVPGQGDWYARFLYVPGHPHYDHHVKTYGHPSKFGYKDIIPLWTADEFDPEALMDQYEAAGAKYFVSMGVHHDNFDLWNSRRHRWNAVALGPKRDIVGAWKSAARKRGLRFGVSEHLGASYCWWHPNHLYDQFWPLLGVPYDGADPQYADLYHENRDEPYLGRGDTWYTNNENFHRTWFNRIRDLVDSYEPDLLYTDGGLPFGVIGRSLVAHFYNSSIARNGKLEAVYTCKDLGSGEFHKEWSVQDVERGVLEGVNPLPWQTDTSNGDWFYREKDNYKTTDEVVAMLADIVSKNGNMLLNVVQYPDGSLPPESKRLLTELAAWMKINSEAIHGTRPWKVFGEGPTVATAGAFQEKVEYTQHDIRFTTKGDALYALTLASPSGQVAITSLGRNSAHERRPVREVRMLGHDRVMQFRQTDQALVVDLPPALPSRHASVFRVAFD